MALARLLLGSAVSAALLATSVAPAAARPYRGHHGGWNGGWHHRDRGVRGGGLLAGVVILGGIAAIAGMSAKKDRQVDDEIAYRNRAYQNRDRTADAYADRSDDGEWRGDDAGGRIDSPAIDDAHAGNDAQVIRDEDAAVDACAGAAEDEAHAYGSNASVRDIADVQGEGTEWRVSGTVETRNGYRDRASARGFTCTVRYGQIDGVRLDGESVALR
ncbi:hypothetical protein [Sphingomonas colocasiae]|uniref:Secreted protein n=1 Tax=Sphingomonas colocasiae TaxID=1848973 RepID=A0ABS7PR27_9SPHN|nr:hypothetical protein [Sphingomonas colocasiae]MBY8823723.1 hypothetical protein [Sphingomonas colocasiae]